MKKLLFFGWIALAGVLICACNLDDFDTDKLVKAEIYPKIYAPLAYGTFKSSDYLPPVNLGLDNDTVNLSEIDLDPISWVKGGIFFDDAMDSVSIVVEFTNATPMKMQVLFWFSDYSSGTQYGKTFDSGILDSGTMDATGKVVKPFVTTKEFAMDASDLQYIQSTNGLECRVKLTQPSTGAVIVKNLKSSTITVHAYFKARLSLGDLN